VLVFGLISPHPPLIIPEIGGEDIKKVRKTTAALERAVGELAEAGVEELIVISPHEDHGFEVPEYYLRRRLSGEMPVEEILVTEDSYQYYFDYGREVGARVRGEKTRYGIVASGDLSHVLRADGPYGFKAAGPVLDELIVAAVRRRDAPALLAIDPVTLNEGAECGLRSILFLLGALEGVDVRTEVLSYEGPFGVGYMVATLAVEEAARITALAREAIGHYLETGEVMAAPKDLDGGWRRRAGAFVSLHEADGELRGCIGTVASAKRSLAEEVMANAVAAATQDPRFGAVRAEELGDLKISVDVLGAAVVERDVARLDPKRYGIIVTSGDGRQGVLLPDLEGVDSAEEQIRICREKGGIGLDEVVEIRRFEVERFEE